MATSRKTGEWNKELQRHCTKEVQEIIIEYFRRKGDQQFMMNGRGAEITIDLVLAGPCKNVGDKINGPEDDVVSDMIKQLPQETFASSPSTSWNASWVRWRHQALGRKPDAEPKKGVRSYRAIALTSVMSKWYAACVILRLEKEEEPEGWTQFHVVGTAGVGASTFRS